MFYRPAEGHGLPHNPFNAIVAPRPIGWISSRGTKGDNLAPYSFFNAIAYVPPQVMFSSTGVKDSLENVRESGVFAVNIVEEAMFRTMSDTSAALAHGVDEFTACNVPKAECISIDCPRVENAPATLECRVTQIIPLLGAEDFMVLGEVTGVHLRDTCLRGGKFDLSTFNPVARLGYRDYTVVREIITLKRPGE